MRMHVAVLATALLVVHHVAAQYPPNGGKGGNVLHTKQEPRLMLFGPDDTKGTIQTWDDASKFCKSKGNRQLASKWEWCRSRDKKDTAKREVYGNVRPDHSLWVPIKGEDYLKIGIGPNDNDLDLCYSWKELYGPKEEKAPKPVNEFKVMCVKPDDCHEDKCDMHCSEDHKMGYYPDPTDCNSYCYCSGESEGSYYETITEEGMTWDPFAFGSKPLNKKNKPLGGMTGGQKHAEHYVDDQSYCTPEDDADGAEERRNLRQALGREERALDEAAYESWKEDPDMQSFDHEYVLCILQQRLREVPKTCSCVWGDPHINTFDSLNYSCQGKGEFVLSKSLESGFEMQGRFDSFGDLQATVTRSVVLQTGFPDEPTMEYNVVTDKNGKCKDEYFVEGKKLNMRYYAWEGTQITGNKAAHLFKSGVQRWFYLPGSDTMVHIYRKKSKAMGCYINACLCVGDATKNSELVGLFGSPNDDPEDDFMDENGQDLEHNGNTEWEHAYTYCHENWCVGSSANSIFSTPMEQNYCDATYDPALEESVKNASPELRALCGGNTACLVEGSAGDVEDSAASVESLKNVGVDVVADQNDTTDVVVEDTTDAVVEIPDTTRKADVEGDPHFKTWDGTSYDFHGGCDLVLLTSPAFGGGKGLDIHIRTKIQHWWSFVESAAVRIGDDVIEVTGGVSDTWFWLNGVAGETIKDGQIIRKKLAGYAVTVRKLSTKKHKIVIHLDNGEQIMIKAFNDFVRVDVDANSANAFEGAVGMMGRYPDGAMIGRDHHTLISAEDKFGMEWQVLAAEPTLFHSTDGTVQAPERCEMPAASVQRRRLEATSISIDEAEKACDLVVDEDERILCISDVLTTQDAETAGAYQ